MIRPTSSAERITGVRMLGSPISGGLQLTIVEIVLRSANENPFDICFTVPDDTADVTEKLLSPTGGGMGPAALNEALDSWELKDTMLRLTGTVSFEAAAPDIAELSGYGKIAVVRVPERVECCSVAWVHAIVHSKAKAIPALHFPSMNTSLRSWMHTFVVIGADASPYATPPATPLSRSLRWDLASAAGVVFPQNMADDCGLVRQNSTALPYHNLFFPLSTSRMDDGVFLTANGAEIVDRTRLRLLAVTGVGFQGVMGLCGCIVRDGFNFQTAHVPFTVTERMTRKLGPLVWEDAPDGSPAAHAIIGDKRVVVNVLEREKYCGVTWVTAKK